MDQFEQLKQKYAPVLEAVKKAGVSLQNLHLQDGKLFMKGRAPSEEMKNEVWNAIKAVDPKYPDIHADITIDPSLPVPKREQTYTVQAGDTLSKISRQFYGDANQYMKIFEANRDQLTDPDKIKVGQVLRIPSA
ncbi:MAG: LysM peptidoglycan-binding domain-containing protein [Acidobacteriota bacterium]|jgi:nucleoid-associated protein YgaU|nr:MAG: peptidoglycan-binding protein [Acidobacteriota bacterium]